MNLPKLKSIILSVLFLTSLNCAAQVNVIIDSLFEELEHTDDPGEQFDLHYYLALRHIGYHNDSAFVLARTAIEMAEQDDDYKKQLSAYFLFANVSINTQSKIAEALAHNEKSLQILEREVSVDQGLKARMYYAIAALYTGTPEKDKAIEYYLKAIPIFSELEDEISLAGIYSNIGMLYTHSSSFDAIKYFRKSLAIHEKIDMPAFKARAMANYGDVLFMEKPDSAFYYLEEAVRIARKEELDPYALNYALDLLTKNYYKNQEYRKALNETLALIPTQQQIEDNHSLQYSTLLVAKCYDQLGQLDSALHYGEQALFYAKMAPTLENTEIYEVLGNLHKKNLNYLKASNIFKEGMLSRDSLYSEEVIETLAENDVRYETTRREAQITQQQLEIVKQKNTRNRLLFGGITLLLATAGIFQFFLYRNRRRKQEVELALAAEAQEAERLRAIDEFKTNFFTNVSHELRTPLTLITSPLEEALGKVKQVNLKTDLELAHQNSRRLLGLINEILDLSKLEAGELATEISTINPIAFLRRVFFSFQSAADIGGITLDWQAPDDLPLEIQTDVAKLEKMLNNLLSNAIKFTPTGGTVSLQLFEEKLTGTNPKLLLKVMDTGQGIHPDDLPRVFDRFYQSAQPQPQGGTGIGLSLSKQLAQLLDGDLNVESTWGAGSTFLLEIPVKTKTATTTQLETVSEEVEDTIAPLALPALQFRAGRPQILIVEDNAEMSQYLLDKLRADYDCHLAENGAQALHLLRQQPFDLITSDVMMPVMDGFALREKINQNADWKRIPFLLLTARTLEEDKIRGFQLGIDDYVTKPFSLPELQARIHNLLINKQERDNSSATESITSPETELLAQAEAYIREHLDDPNLSVREMAKSLGYSQRNLARIFNQMTGLTPVKFVLEVRLQHARHLLEKRQFATVIEVCYEVGIESRSYFTTKFKQRFGKSPKAYLEDISQH